jgi:hypothetical protein
MNTARLLHLREVAQHIPMNRLDMGMWGGCGTHACLAGWACRDKKFNVEGLALVDSGGGFVPGFNRRTSFQALDTFFDLHGLETTHLFSPIAYSAQPNREELLQHIDDILAGDFEEKFGRYAEYFKHYEEDEALERIKELREEAA